MTNPFNRADKHGAPDMRVTAPPSAGTPMQPPVNVQFMTAREQVEHGHRTRGEPTYAELQAINAEMLQRWKHIWKTLCVAADCGMVMHPGPRRNAKAILQVWNASSAAKHMRH